LDKWEKVVTGYDISCGNNGSFQSLTDASMGQKYSLVDATESAICHIQEKKLFGDPVQAVMHSVDNNETTPAPLPQNFLDLESTLAGLMHLNPINFKRCFS
jgi:hypothetical protein